MLKDIIKKEILDRLLSSKFVFMFIICSALILLSVHIGTFEYLENRKIHEDDENGIMWALTPPNTYGMIGEGAVRLYRPPQTLGIIVKGVENAAGRASYPHLPEVGLSESMYESNPLTAVFGVFDLMFIVKMALSLFAILLIYDTICGEREKGTLKLSLSNSVPRDRLLLGKFIGGYISLCIPLLLPLLLSLIYLSLHPAIGMTGEEWRRLAVIFLMFLVYLSVFFCLGLLVSSLTARSSTSLIVLLFIWCVWGMVVPKASVIIAGMLRPIPSQNEIYTQKALSSNEVSQELAPRQQGLMEQFNVKMIPMDGNRYRIEGDYQGYQAALRELDVERARLVSEKNVKIDSDYQLKKAAQASLAKNLSRISPASALTFSATALARTGVDDYNRFLKAMLDYKPVMSNWLRTSPDIRNEKGGYKEIDPVTLAGMPRPAIAHDNLGVTVVRVLPDLIAMFVMIVLLTGGAYFAFIRCDVR